MSGEYTMITTMLSVFDSIPLENVNYGADKVHSLLDCDNSLDNPMRIIPDTVETKVICPHVTIKNTCSFGCDFQFQSHRLISDIVLICNIGLR